MFLSVGACLYVGGINHAPTVEVGPANGQSLANLRLGDALRLETTSTDAEDPVGDLSYAWRIHGVDLDQKRFAVTDLTGATSSIVAEHEVGVISTAASLSLITLSRRGRYQVEVSVKDPLGALGVGRLTFEVNNKPPVIDALRIAGQDLAPQTQGNPAGATWVATVVARDDDDPLRCGGGSNVSWIRVAPKSNKLFLRWDVLPCPAGGAALDRLIFAADPKAIPAAMTVTLQATVTDRRGGSASRQETITLRPARPPCVFGTEPHRELVVYTPRGGVGVELRGYLVADVLHRTRFVWSVADRATGPFATLSNQPDAALSIAADALPPGGVRHYRLEVRDDVSGSAACPPGRALCAEGLPPSSKGCYRWATWEVEFR